MTRLPNPRTAASILAVAAALCLSAPVAGAHDVVIGGSPANEEELQDFPDVIELEFSGYVKEDFNTVAVSDVNSGEVLFSGAPAIDGRWATLDVPADLDAGPGDYQIGFQITSSDGHSTRGMTTFSVAGDVDTQAPAAPSPETTPEATGTDTLLEGPLAWVLGGVGVLAVLGVIVMMIARGTTTHQE